MNGALLQGNRLLENLVLPQGHHRHALGVAGGLHGQLRRGEDQSPPVGAVEHQLPLAVLEEEHGLHRALVGVGAGELAAVGLGGVAGEIHSGGFAVFKEEEQASAVVAGENDRKDALALVHGELGRQEVAQHGGLGVVKFREAGLVDLALVGEDQELRAVGGLLGEGQAVALFELLLRAHAQALGGDLLEVALPGEEHRHRVVGHVLLGRLQRKLAGVHQGGAPGLAVLVGHGLELLDDDVPDLLLRAEDLLELLDLLGQGFGVGDALEDILLIDVPELDLRHKLRLHLVDAEADHQVGDDLGVGLGLADDFDGQVDVQEDLFKTLQEVQPVFLFLELEVNPTLDAPGAPGRPLLENLPHPKHLGASFDENVEVAGEAVLEGRQAHQPRHELLGIHAPL